eukprot:8111120-Ditylum_brightwellii.AAC.1
MVLPSTRSRDSLPRRSRPGDACSPSDSPSRCSRSRTSSGRTTRSLSRGGGNGDGGNASGGG